jgi:hypothetical protein
MTYFLPDHRKIANLVIFTNVFEKYTFSNMNFTKWPISLNVIDLNNMKLEQTPSKIPAFTTDIRLFETQYLQER